MKGKVKIMDDKKYLIVECKELNDPYECDADRTPLGMTADISIWQQVYGYEIYVLKTDGRFKLIKDYEAGRLYIEQSNRKTYYLVDENECYAGDLTNEMKNLLN